MAVKVIKNGLRLRLLRLIHASAPRCPKIPDFKRSEAPATPAPLHKDRILSWGPGLTHRQVSGLCFLLHARKHLADAKACRAFQEGARAL